MKEPLSPPPPHVSGAGNQRTKSPYQLAAKRLLQGEMARHGYGYRELADAMGEGDTDTSLITRVNRGTFSMAFFLKAVRVMGAKTIDISHLPSAVRKVERGS